jgi:hypothetical protein
VGADKGDGPVVLSFDGSSWRRLATGQRGDLWWVHAFPDGTALMGGAGAMVLSYSEGRFERLPTPGLARQTVFGVWGVSRQDFYATGSSSGRDGFVWHFRDGSFHDEPLPRSMPLAASGQLPGFFKVWGHGDDVWVVGTAGVVLHRKGTNPFTLVPTGTKDTLFTASGLGDRVVIVGGGSNGVALEGSGAGLHDISPPAAALLQGIYVTPTGDWADGERGAVYFRKGDDAFRPVEHALPIPPSLSLHSIYVDASGGVWAAGGNVLSLSRDQGLLVHFGSSVPEIDPHVDATAAAAPPSSCPNEVVAIAKDRSVARRWDEQALAAIRLDLPRPAVHARNLFHLSVAMWDAWAAYDTQAEGVFAKERHRADDVERARREAISYAAFGVLGHRYEGATGGATTLACISAVMRDLGYDPSDTHDEGDDPTAVGNRIAHRVLAETASDGSHEAEDYRAPAPLCVNAPLIYDHPGTPAADPSLWQPLVLSVAVTHNGIELPSGEQEYMGSEWGSVSPFALTRTARTTISAPWVDVPAAPKMGPSMNGSVVEVIRKQSEMDLADGATLDISPGATGHDSLGADDGAGWAKNPVSGKPYPPEVVPRADFARVVAELWEHGPHDETPPGHWNLLANQVSDSPDFTRRLFGTGPSVDPLSWDVHVYLALNGALHDAAIAAYDQKRRSLSSRPITLVRWMAENGTDRLPLVPGLVEVITAESSAPGQRHDRLAPFVGQIAVRGWIGEPEGRARQTSGVTWIRAADWIPYQSRGSVTPPDPGFVSEESAWSRAAAEVLSGLTGSPYFPGGLASYDVPASTFLALERGPSRPVRLEWASYADAADQAGQSGVWGGIHIPPDDLAGRRVGYRVGRLAVVKARAYYEGKAR